MSEGEDKLEMRERIVIEDHPFDVGYWARYFGLPQSSTSGEYQEGWRECDRELAHEAAYRSIPEAST